MTPGTRASSSMTLDAVLFDLDGTLVDTAPALAAALNTLCQLKGQPPLAYEQIRPVVSRGGAALVALAFADGRTSEQRETLRLEFLQLYAERLHRQPQESSLFTGMPALLDRIEKRGWRWGIVTNKPAWLTAPLLEALELTERPGCLICGDQVSRPKPDPEALLLACQQLGCTPQRTVYIGDAERDIQAGRAAGLKTLVAAYGYLDADDDPAGWAADGIVADTVSMDSWLCGHAGD